ncbi:hypothetical protein LTR43_012367, partial [Exophiala xenobiotica]
SGDHHEVPSQNMTQTPIPSLNPLPPAQPTETPGIPASRIDGSLRESYWTMHRLSSKMLGDGGRTLLWRLTFGTIMGFSPKLLTYSITITSAWESWPTYLL